MIAQRSIRNGVNELLKGSDLWHVETTKKDAPMPPQFCFDPGAVCLRPGVQVNAFHGGLNKQGQWLLGVQASRGDQIECGHVQNLSLDGR